MSAERLDWAYDLVDGFLSDRLDAAGDIPGLRQATATLAARTLASAEFEQLFTAQLRQLRRPRSRIRPDAYLANEAAVEDALQEAAAGIRSAMAQNGQITDGRPFEVVLADTLGDDPGFAIRAEIARVARPPTRPDPLSWSITAAPWGDDPRESDHWPPPGAAIARDRTIAGGLDSLARVNDGPHTGWVQIGLIESQWTPACLYPERPVRSMFLGVGLEVGDEPPPGTLPFTSATWLIWDARRHRLDPTTDRARAVAVLSARRQALVAVAVHVRGPDGLGEPLHTLVPTLPLVAALDLEPTPGLCGFSLGDSRGPALIGRQWRGHPVHDGNYEPTIPAVNGADLLLRPDLVEKLRDVIDETHFRAGMSVHCTEREASSDDDPI